MNALKWTLRIIAAVLTLLLVIPAFLPGAYHVERSIVIAAPPETVHRYVGDLSRWDEWIPWKQADPTIETTIDVATGASARQRWTGASGSGELTFTRNDPATGIAYEMTLDGDFRSTAEIRYDGTAAGTTVTWTMDGSADGWLTRYFVLMMDSMAGSMYEDGLARLKAKAEAASDGAPAPGPSEAG